MLGLMALTMVGRLNTQFFPTVHIPTIFVTGPGRGASPETSSTAILT